jgi:4-hydroxybenzoate polyprenyltransferase/phosphoserine phosphatase
MNHPLVVDLDGTLLRTDMLLESMLAYLKQGIGKSLTISHWLLQGKAKLKEELAKQVKLNVEFLPYNTAVVEFLHHARQQQQEIILATATHKIYAEQIANYLGVFDRVIATDNDINLSSHNKRDRLIEEFGEKGFDYIGNSHADIPVLCAAYKAYLADPNAGVKIKMKNSGNIASVFNTRPHTIKTIFRTLRPHQWNKNLLVFIPLLASHQITNISFFPFIFLAFILFSLTASSGYIINDLLDLESDRHHPRKRYRPLASGELPLQLGLFFAPTLFIASLSLSLFFLPLAFTISLSIYYILTISYSQYFKKIAFVDTIVLAGLYTIRILAGVFACNLIPTFWILAFSLFLFLSLALVKRYAELLDSRLKGDTTKTKGRGYFPADLEIIASLGTASGYLSVLVLALYIQDAKTITMYKTHELIWLACPILLFWISRMWMITHRGQMNDDPVLFAVKDRTSLITAGMFASVFILAIIL